MELMPSLPPTGGPASEDEPILVREPLAPERKRHDIELRQLLNLVSLTLVAMLVVVGAEVGLHRLRPPPTARATVPTLAFPTSTPPLSTGSTLPVSQEWMPAGPPWAQQIVFAPSSPHTAYVCGTPTNNDSGRQAPVELGTSLDSGRTWQTLDTPILASGCQLDIDPTNAQDLLLSANHCLNCGNSRPAQLYRSVDGGRSWHLAVLPTGHTSTNFVGFQWAWQRVSASPPGVP